ncbi:MAG: hypothetical protein KAZ30_01430 [Candidatus Magasanikbacteria bacterium]|nr:hypothetical protein [Candidatus Magasanikbacteria bacterium]
MIFLKKIRVYCQENRAVLALSFFIGLTFFLTWHGFFTGYEKETWQAAESWVNGDFMVRRGGPVAIALYLPFVVLARLIPILHTERFFSLVPVLYSSLQVAILFFIAKRISGSEKISLIFASVVALTSGVWVYANAGMEYQAGLFISLLLLLLLQWREKINFAWVPSLGMTALIGTKAYMASLGLPYVLFLALVLYQRGQTKKFWSVRFLLSAGLIPGLFIIGSLLINWWLFGRLSGSYRLGGEFQVWQWWEGFYAIFFSANKNIFLYAPLLIPTLWLWPRFYRRESALTVFIFASLGLLAVINLPFSYWTDETWGVRKFIPLIPLLHLPLLIFLAEWKNKTNVLKIVFTLLVSLALVINFLGASYTYARQLTLARAGNVDSLITLRYIPDWSHPRIFGELFASYMRRIFTGVNTEKHYAEPSWFRWVQAPGYDIILREARLDLKNFDQPSIIWLEPRHWYQKVGGILVIGWLVSFWHLYLLIKKAK